MIKYVMVLLMLVSVSNIAEGGLLNSTNHTYHVSIGVTAGSINSTNHTYEIVVGIPSSKSLNATSHLFHLGMLTEPPTAVTCWVSSGQGTIWSITGNKTNAIIDINAEGTQANVTCTMNAFSNVCNYLARNASFVIHPLNISQNYTSCNILVSLNQTPSRKLVTIYNQSTVSSEFGRFVAGGLAIVSSVFIYMGYRKTSTTI